MSAAPPQWELLEAAFLARAVADPYALVGVTGIVCSKRAAYAIGVIRADPLLCRQSLSGAVGLSLSLDVALGRITEEFANSVYDLALLAEPPTTVTTREAA